MRAKSGDSLGRVLLQEGTLDEQTVQDVLDQQRHTLPFASLCYVLGLADEGALVRALSKQAGFPGVVFDQSVIDLRCLEGFDRDLCLEYSLLPIFEDASRLYVAVGDPGAVAGVLREIQFVRGKVVVPHIALHITLARAIRSSFVALARGQHKVFGTRADPDSARPTIVVSEMSDSHERSAAAAAREAVVDDVTKEVKVEELLSMDPFASEVTTEAEDTHQQTQQRQPSTLEGEAKVIDFDEHPRDKPAASQGPKTVLLVDDDFASRHLLVKELQPLGYSTQTASSGGEAVRILKRAAPDAVVLDVMLPEIDGFQICRAIKQSERYRHIPVILMSAVIDSGRVTDRVLRQYGADAYFEKPLNTERLKARLNELLSAVAQEAPPRAKDDTFRSALEFYRRGDVEGAVAQLRKGIREDPLSPKHHFVLANLLQKQELLYEAIDEYEATVDLRPDYFPALTRLAYLYYKKGFSAKAIETWRRSLPYCTDNALRENIEVFMRRLIAGMQASP